VGFARPAMTTVALDAGAIARAVGDFFKARDSGARPGKRRVIPANLVLRQSAKSIGLK
jgi:DNA-binding LacI/PurR family transcriptional regulator